MKQTSLENVKAFLCFLQVMLFARNRFQQLTIETMYMNRLRNSDPTVISTSQKIVHSSKLKLISEIDQLSRSTTLNLTNAKSYTHLFTSGNPKS